MQKLDSHSETPLYIQLYDELKKAIELGIYRSGDQIPAEDKLREMYGISRITVRKALDKLIEDRVLVRRHGKGTFVAKTDYVEVFGAGGSFTKSCLMMNAVPTTRILDVCIGNSEKKIEECLKLAPGEKMIIIKRLRCVDGVPVIVETDYFSMEFDFLMELDLTDCSLHQVLREQRESRIYRFQDIFDICPCENEQAQLLNCEEGYPLLRVCEQAYGIDNQILYYNEQYILADHYKYALSSVSI